VLRNHPDLPYPLVVERILHELLPALNHQLITIIVDLPQPTTKKVKTDFSETLSPSTQLRIEKSKVGEVGRNETKMMAMKVLPIVIWQAFMNEAFLRSHANSDIKSKTSHRNK